MIETFDYEKYAQQLAENHRKMIPKDFYSWDERYILNIIYTFCVLSLEYFLMKKYEVKNACEITKYIAEWTFKKSVELTKVGIKKEYKFLFLSTIAFTIIEIGKQSIANKISEEYLKETIKYQVEKQNKIIAIDLLRNDVISQKQYDSYINQIYSDKNDKKIKSITSLASLRVAFLFFIFIILFYNIYSKNFFTIDICIIALCYILYLTYLKIQKNKFIENKIEKQKDSIQRTIFF